MSDTKQKESNLNASRARLAQLRNATHFHNDLDKQKRITKLETEICDLEKTLKEI